MIPFKQLKRIHQIIKILLDHGVDEFLGKHKNLGGFRTLRLLYPLRKNRFPQLSRGERLCQALHAIGPIYVKFGQMLSTRRDILPPDVAEALAQLQDQVPSFSEKEARQIIEQETGLNIEALCLEFSEQPLASASIAQVHAGTLATGEEVVFKVLRPGIEKQIEQDIALLKTLAKFISKTVADSKRLKLTEVIADYETTIYDELDLLREAANSAQLKRNAEKSKLLYVPQVHWQYTTPKLMVSERIYGIPIRDNAQLDAKNVNRKVLAERGVEIFFSQVFRDNFFHADMHPGNIFVDASNPQDPTYIGIDCGIIGTLSRDDQKYLAENFIAFFNRDYQKVAQLHLDSGWVPPETDVREFEFAIRTACEPIFGKPLAEISFGYFLLRLFETARRFNMEVQPQLVLLQKTFFYIEGLGRELYPQLDLWASAKPFLENWMKERLSIRSLFQELKAEYPFIREKAPQMLALMHQHLQASSQVAKQLDAAIANKNQELKIEKRRYLAILGATLCLASSIVASKDSGIIALALMGTAFLLGLVLIWKSRPVNT